MALARRTLLWASKNKWIRRQFTQRAFAKRAVKRFMPGEDSDAALSAAEKLAESKVLSLLTLLGENTNSRKDAEEVTAHYLRVLERIGDIGIPSQISIKPTQLGLDISRDMCSEQLDALLNQAAAKKNFVWLDMESSEYVDPTLELLRRARENHDNVGICLQSSLYRTTKDLDLLLASHTSIRLVKGAYREPPSIAFPRKKDVDANYLALAIKMLSAGLSTDSGTAAFGTHDIGLVNRIIDEAARQDIASDRFEVQMLYGIGREHQLRLAEAGRCVRVLISYGAAWFPWYMRRLAERPANVWFVVKTALRP